MADWRLPKYQALVSGAASGDPQARQKLDYLRQSDPALTSRLDREAQPGTTAGEVMGGALAGAPEPTAPTAQPTQPPSPPTPTPPPAPPTAPAAPAAPGAENFPSWLTAAAKGAGPAPDVSGRNLAPWIPTTSGRLLSTLAGSEPRIPEPHYLKGLQDRWTQTWEQAKADWGTDVSRETSQASATALPHFARQGMALAEGGQEGAIDVLRQWIESHFAVNSDGSLNLNAPQYGDIAGRAAKVLAILPMVNELARIGYNNWPSQVRRDLTAWDEARNVTYPRMLEEQRAQNLALRRGYEADVSARSERMAAAEAERSARGAAATETRRLERLRAGEEYSAGAERAASGAQQTLREADLRLADFFRAAEPNPELSYRSQALAASREPPDIMGAPPTDITLRGQSYFPGNRQGPMTIADVTREQPGLIAARARVHGASAARVDASALFDRAAASTDPATTQALLRRGYELLERHFPGIQRDPTWQSLVQRAERVEQLGAPVPPQPPITPEPVVPRPDYAPRPEMPEAGRGPRPERPTYREARNRTLGRAVAPARVVAKYGLIGAAAGASGQVVAQLFKAYTDALGSEAAAPVPPTRGTAR